MSNVVASAGSPTTPRLHGAVVVLALVLTLTSLATPGARAQAPPALPYENPYADEPIEDNSFLVEEAYNQEDAVIQHISLFTRATDGDSWAFVFTQEWPVPIQEHQLSYTLLAQGVENGDQTSSGLGDVALNYRYQAVRSPRLWFAPRASLLLPTGDPGRALGAGGWGMQFNLPLSARLTRLLVAHTNVGYTYVSGADDGDGNQADTNAFNLGQSLILLAAPRFNLMLEGVWTSFDVITGPDRTEREDAAFVSPGVRFAFDLPSGLQIVPGLAFPIGVGPSDGDRSVLVYLSFEHPFGPLAR